MIRAAEREGEAFVNCIRMVVGSVKDGSYSRSGQRRELWYTRTISIVEPRTR
jgi:hypothetical protein